MRTITFFAMLTLLLVASSLSVKNCRADTVFDFAFSKGFEGWSSPDSNVTWEPTDGNPGGYIKKDDNGSTTVDDEWLYAPNAILGNWSAYDLIGTISFEHRIFSTGDVGSFIPYQLFIAGPSGNATWSGNTPSGATNWVYQSAILNQSNWSVTGDWNSLLANVTDFRVRIEVVSNSSNMGEIVGLDNIRLTTVPEPNVVLTLLTGTLLLIGWRQRVPNQA
jgi:hypothetical protein